MIYFYFILYLLHISFTYMAFDIFINEISILIFFKFYCKLNRNQLKMSENQLKADTLINTSNIKYNIWMQKPDYQAYGSSFKFPAAEIKGLLISLDFRTQNTEFLLLFYNISKSHNPNKAGLFEDTFSGGRGQFVSPFIFQE